MPSGNISITFGAKFETYAINGQMTTVAQAVKRFFSGSAPSNSVIHLNGRAQENLGQALREGDVILVLDKNLASGGYKQAV